MNDISLDSEVLQSWIGLETYDGYKLTKLLAIGSSQVVYEALNNDRQAFVMKFPKSHLGFFIELPPNSIFRIHGDSKLPHNAFIQVLTNKDVEYERKLNSRLLALCGSPLLSNIIPLNIIWQKLAFDILQATWHEFRDHSNTKSFLSNLFSHSDKKSTRSHEDSKSQNYMRLARHKALIHSTFIIERLREWAATDCETNPNEMIAIYAGDEPIHADFPETFVMQSTHALQKVDMLFEEIGVSEPKNKVDKNPFLPFIAALSLGYQLPSESVTGLAKLLDQQEEISETLLQLGQVLHFLTPTWNRDEKSQIISFIMAVGSHSTKIGLPDLLICLQELK